METTDKILIALCAIVSLSFVLIPLTNDVRIFFGSAHIAAQFYPFPQGVDLAWELKPVFNRIIFYLLYKMATLFSHFSDPVAFGFCVKSISLIPVTVVSVYFARVMRLKTLFFLCFLSFVSVGVWGSLQAEWWGSLMAIASMALLLHGRSDTAFLSGAIAGALFFVKGITGLFIIPIIATAYILGDDSFYRGQYEFWTGVVAAILCFIGLAFTIWPNMIPDMLMIPAIAKIGTFGIFERGLFFLEWLFISWIWIPVLLPGLVFGIWFAVKRLPVSSVSAPAYLATWIAPVAMIVFTGEFFGYHYLVFIPSVVSTYVIWRRCR